MVIFYGETWSPGSQNFFTLKSRDSCSLVHVRERWSGW